MWRSHLDALQYSEEENRHLGEAIEEAGGEVLLDQRVRRGGSHHQKLVVLRHPDEPRPRRRLRRRHRPVPQPARRRRPPRRPAGGADGPAVRRPAALARRAARAARAGGADAWTRRSGSAGTTRCRWTPRTRMAYLRDRLRHADLTADPLPDQPPTPPPGRRPHTVQVLRTYPAVRPRYPFAPDGERSIARGYVKAIRRARRLIYLEDQYLWSTEVADLFAAGAARATPTCTWSPWCRGTPTSTAGSRCRRTMVGREHGAAAVPQGRRRPGARLRRGEPRGHPGVRARQGLRRRRRLGQRRQRQLQPPLVDARQRAVLRGARRRRATSGSRGTPPGSATAPGSSPATCGCGCWREHLDRADGDDADLVDPATAVPAMLVRRRGAGGLARRRPARARGRPAGCARTTRNGSGR